MIAANKREPILLFFGDLILFVLALWVTLMMRYGTFPAEAVFVVHIIPFSVIFATSIFVFFVAGLYEKHTLIFKSYLPALVARAQIANAVIAIAFFYFIPYFEIAPKTNLFLYLVISSIFIFLWRLYGIGLLGVGKRENAILVGSGDEMQELRHEVNENPRYGLRFISSIDLDEVSDIDFEDEVISTIYREGVTSVVIDLRNTKVEPFLPRFYNLIFSRVQFIDTYKVYEDIFDRVPLSALSYSWFLENISSRSHVAYDALKRGMDVGVAAVLGLITLAIYPFVWIAIKLDDNGPVVFWQDRVGRENHVIQIVKFRSMTTDEKPQVTRVGKVLRRTRIDELPQLWNVLRGDLSLIGPRPELPKLTAPYEEAIPYYNIRHLIKPGLSGWAQIHQQEDPPKFDVAYHQTRVKLSYDLYYIKNRSLLLDLKIALRTLQALASRVGK